MSLLANFTSDDTITGEKDSVGGGRGPIESGLYLTTISLAYLKTSAGGAHALVILAKTADDKEIEQTIYFTSGTAKGCKNYYEDKDGQKQYLPGYNMVNSIALLTLGKEISQLDTEEKVIKLYSYDAKADVPTKVNMVTDLIGQEVLLGVIKQTVDKNVKNEATGAYEASGETREENELDKVFRARDRMTTAEIRGKAEEASFADVWNDKWAGKTRNKAKGAAAGGVAGAPKAAAAAKPKASLFA